MLIFNLILNFFNRLEILVIRKLYIYLGILNLLKKCWKVLQFNLNNYSHKLYILHQVHYEINKRWNYLTWQQLICNKSILLDSTNICIFSIPDSSLSQHPPTSFIMPSTLYSKSSFCQLCSFISQQVEWKPIRKSCTVTLSTLSSSRSSQFGPLKRKIIHFVLFRIPANYIPFRLKMHLLT